MNPSTPSHGPKEEAGPSEGPGLSFHRQCYRAASALLAGDGTAQDLHLIPCLHRARPQLVAEQFGLQEALAARLQGRDFTRG